jgi:predicted Zn-ribbon and HTH transcriptional regulator
MDKFESSYSKFIGYTKSMVNVLCFDCGLTFEASYGTPNITKACPKCQEKMWETQSSFEE